MSPDPCPGYASAGDLEKFSYCPMSWHLSKTDAKEDNLNEGVSRHRHISGQVETIARRENAATDYERAMLVFATVATFICGFALFFLPKLSSINLALTFGTMALVWLALAIYLMYRSTRVEGKEAKSRLEKWVVGISMGASIIAVMAFTYHFSDIWLSKVLIVVALLWLLMTSYFLHRHLEALREVRRIRNKRRLASGEIRYVDDLSQSPLLVSEKYCIRGRPDYIIFRDGEYIPVEEKTGRTPLGPYFSHIMQMTAYCLLVREVHGKCGKGIIKYEDKDFEVLVDSRTMNAFLDIREAFDAAVRTGKVHRNHNRPGKCQGCSRRADCPESLVRSSPSEAPPPGAGAP